MQPKSAARRKSVSRAKASPIAAATRSEEKKPADCPIQVINSWIRDMINAREKRFQETIFLDGVGLLRRVL
jgi:hypothetical protein